MGGRKKPTSVSFAEYTGLALTLPVATLVGYAIGYGLDRAFGTHFLNIVFLILGSAAGFVNFIRHVMADARDK